VVLESSLDILEIEPVGVDSQDWLAPAAEERVALDVVPVVLDH